MGIYLIPLIFILGCIAAWCLVMNGKNITPEEQEREDEEQAEWCQQMARRE